MRKLLMLDPEFSPGSEHTAHALMTNNTPKAWTYNAELYLVKAGTKYTSSGMITFSLAAGASRTIDFPIIMPDKGTYKVYLDIYVAGELVAAYTATEDVTIIAAPPPLAFSYSNERADSLPKSNPNYHWLLFECDITNPNPVEVTGIVGLWRQNHRGDIKDLSGYEACNSGYSRCPECKDPGQVELTLAPGESYHYRFCSYNASYLYVSRYYLWVTDNMGGESAHARVG